MKKRLMKGLLIIPLLIFCAGLVFAVVNFFVSQAPADVSTTNVLGTSLNISYNISNIALNFSSISLFYKVNSSTSDTNFFFTNGTLTSGFQKRNYSSNSSDVFLFRLFHDQVYPAVYNYNESYMQSAVHVSYDLNLDAEYVKIRFFNVSNEKNYSFLEIYAENQTSIASTLRFYYCNFSYVTGNPAGSSVCTNFFSLSNTQPFNHTHQVSKHHVIPFAINSTSGTIGSVYITPTSYFLVRGVFGAGDWNVNYITNVAMSDTIQTSQNSGGSWTNLAGTVDSHLHQYDGSETFWYYACASNSTGTIYTNCTNTTNTMRSDLLNLSGLPPSAVNIYSPMNHTYKGLIYINYTAAASPNGYPIFIYNITLRNQSDDFVSIINPNNSLNLSYVWNSSGTDDGIYNFHVSACDSNFLCTLGESDDFTIDNTNPSISSFSCSPQVSYPNDLVTCSCAGSDAIGVNTTVYELHPSTADIGSNSTSCNVTDFAGNSILGTFSYSVISRGGSASAPSSSSQTPAAVSPVEFGENETIKENEALEVIVENTTYILNITEVKNNSAKVIFSYDDIEREMAVGEELVYEIKDNIVTIHLEAITNQGALFNVLLSKKSFSEKYKDEINYIAIVLAGILLMFFIIRFLIRYKKYLHVKKLIKKKISKPYIHKPARREVSRKVQKAYRLREKAAKLLKEARQEKRQKKQKEMGKRVQRAYELRKKSSELIKEANKICRNCKEAYAKK